MVQRTHFYLENLFKISKTFYVCINNLTCFITFIISFFQYVIFYVYISLQVKLNIMSPLSQMNAKSKFLPSRHVSIFQLFIYLPLDLLYRIYLLHVWIICIKLFFIIWQFLLGGSHSNLSTLSLSPYICTGRHTH